MKVCIIVEGTYPYITGGVSTWIQMLVENMPDVNFGVVHLAPWRWTRSFGYKLPKNLNNIYEYLLFSLDYKYNSTLDLKRIINHINDLISFSKSQRSQKLSEIIKEIAGKNIDFVLKTKAFWEFLVDIYTKHFQFEGFTSFYWTVVGFLIPILGALQAIPPKADIYHSTTTGYASLSALVGKYIHNGKLIITEHGIYHREREIEITKSKSVQEVYKNTWIEIFRLISETAYRECDFLTTLFEKNQLFQLELNSDFKKMRVIANGVDVDKFGNIKRIEHHTFNVAIIGRVVPIKDIITGIKAFDIVSKEVPNSKLYIIGPTDEDEDYYKRCIQLVNLFELNDKVVFTGKVNVLDYYGLIDALLISSISEGQPLVQLEAMASGIPVVTTNVGNCSEIALDPDGQSGFVVEPKDYNAMAERLIELAKNKELWNTFSSNGKRIVRKKYRLDQMIKAYKELYMEVLKV